MPIICKEIEDARRIVQMSLARFLSIEEKAKIMQGIVMRTYTPLRTAVLCTNNIGLVVVGSVCHR